MTKRIGWSEHWRIGKARRPRLNRSWQRIDKYEPLRKVHEFTPSVNSSHVAKTMLQHAFGHKERVTSDTAYSQEQYDQIYLNRRIRKRWTNNVLRHLDKECQ